MEDDEAVFVTVSTALTVIKDVFIILVLTIASAINAVKIRIAVFFT